MTVNSHKNIEMMQRKLDGLDLKVRELHFKWKYFTQVFGDQEKVALLNNTAPAFFRSAEDSMLQDILLSIARLVDPAVSAGKANLSFRNVKEDIIDASLQNEVSESISRLEQKIAVLKVWRNKTLAHNDLSQSIGGVPLPSIQVQELTEAFAIIRQIMNVLSQRLRNTTVLYEESITPLGDGNALLVRLKLGSDILNEDPASSKVREVFKWLHTIEDAGRTQPPSPR